MASVYLQSGLNALNFLRRFLKLSHTVDSASSRGNYIFGPLHCHHRRLPHHLSLSLFPPATDAHIRFPSFPLPTVPCSNCGHKNEPTKEVTFLTSVLQMGLALIGKQGDSSLLQQTVTNLLDKLSFSRDKPKTHDENPILPE